MAAEIVDVAGGNIAEVRITLAEGAGPGASVAPAEPREAEVPLSRKLALASLLGGGVSLAASVATGVLSLRAKADLDRKVDTLGIDQRAVSDQRTKVERLSLSTDVLIGASAALVVTGTVTWLLSNDDAERDARSKSRADLDLSVGLRSVALTGRF